MRISCFIIALNEVDRIGPTIRSVQSLADEIIVVDSGSTDGTQDLATSLGARVIHNPWPGFGQQKRFAEDQCRNDWLLNIDADEVVTPELAAEIANLEPQHAAYGVWSLAVYPGQSKPRPFARDHFCLRLYDRRRARFRDSAIHDSVVADGSIGQLRHPLHHHSFRSLEDLASKLDRRATYLAENSKPRSALLLWLRLATEMPVSFCKSYIVRRHITGGWMGVKVAALAAYYRWQRIVRILERQRAAKAGDVRTLNSKV